MKRFFLLSLFCTLLCGFSAMAEETVAYTLTPAKGSNNSYASSCDVTISGITWNVTGNATSIPWRLGGKSLTGVDRAIYSKTAISDNISSVVVTNGTASNITINSLTLTVASDAAFSNVVSTVTGTFAASGTTTFTRPDGADWTGRYYKFVYNVTVSGTSNKFVEFSEAVFNKTVAAGKTATTTNFTANSATAYIGESFTAPTASVAANGTEISGATVTYSSSETGVATVNGTTGAVTLVAPGTATITASYAGDDAYEASSASYTLTVGKAYADLAALVADGAPTSTAKPVKTTLTNEVIQSIFVTQNGYRNGLFLKSGNQEIEVYCKDVPEAWVANGTISGTITGNWVLYGSTWEIVIYDWTQLTYTAPVVKTITGLAVSGTPTKTTYNAGDAFDPAGLTVTATYNVGDPEVITTGFEWDIDYGTGNTAFVAGATSVNVMAYIGEDVLSNVYTVNNLTVNVPVTLTSIAVSGTPTKTAYYAGDAFETAGLVVTGTYSDGTTAVITEGIDWVIDYGTGNTALVTGATSVSVMAGVGTVTSDEFTVNVTVTANPTPTVTYTFSSFTSGQDVTLTDLEGFTITLSKNNGGTNPAWNADQAKVYANGSLTVKANNAIIKSIEYTYTVNANKNGVTPTIDGVAGKTTAGTWDAETNTWTGSDDEVTFSTSGSAGNIGFTKLIITYVQGSKTETTLAWSANAATVTINANDNVFPTLTTTPADLTGVTYESSNTAVATIAEDGAITLVRAGETTITAKYAGDETHAEAVAASYTLTVNEAPFVPVAVAEGYETVDFTSVYSEVTTSANVETYKGTSFKMDFAKPQSSTTPTKYYKSGSAVRAYLGNTITITAAENILSVVVKYVDTYKDDAEAFTGLGTTTAVVTFSKTCRFTDITVYYKASTKVAVSTYQYATYYNAEMTYVMPQGLEGITVTGADDHALTLSKKYNAGDIVPAGEAIVLHATTELEENTEFSLIPRSNNKSISTDNLLKGVSSNDEETTGGSVYYRLTVGSDDKVGFYWGATDGKAFKPGANKAYLALPETTTETGNAPRRFLFETTDTATAVEDVEATEAAVKFFEDGKLLIKKNGHVYNAMGQFVR